MTTIFQIHLSYGLMIHLYMKYLSVHVVDTAGDEQLIDFDPMFDLLDLTYRHPMYDCFGLLSATNCQLDENYEHSSYGYSTMIFGYTVCCR